MAKAFKFKVGEYIVEPSLGVCTVEGVRRMTIDEKEEDYYIFQSKTGNAKVMVPKSQIDKRGVRKPMSYEEIKKMYSLLRQPIAAIREDARIQYMNYMAVMKTGDSVKITRLLRELYIHEDNDDLKGREKDIMERAKKFLCDEILHVKEKEEISRTKITEQINDSLKTMIKKKIAKEKEKKEREKEKK